MTIDSQFSRLTRYLIYGRVRNIQTKGVTILNKHRNATHQMLLDACLNHIEAVTSNQSVMVQASHRQMLEAIEAASLVVVEE